MKGNSNKILYGSIFMFLLPILVACSGQATEQAPPTATGEVIVEVSEEVVTNAVSVEDQALGEGNTVTIASAVADTDGWIVIHAQADGSPGPVLGHAPVSAGENNDISVEIDPAGATETLYAMLHIDDGVAGEYEFPGPDGPALDAGGNVVTPPFTLTGMADAADASVLLSGNDELGEFLVAANGMTLYTFANDEPGLSNCYDQCAQNWPPLLADEGQTSVAGDGVSGELATTERTDNTLQVTYNGLPLYFWVNDTNPGDTTGHGVGDVWFVAVP
jgi:predicted lipoprotein with Yx(FWY)xxD motif